MRHDIITFGSATLDVFLKSKDFLVRKEKKFVTGKGICFPFASKVDIKDVFFSTGGGGTNVAATFSNQGFKVAYCGKIGKDIFGKEILKDLKKFKIDTRSVLETGEKPTNCSIIFSFGKDRTVFVYRGASEILKKEEIPWKEFKANWFYLAPLSGKLANLFGPLVNFAKENKIKVACNPGNSQINLNKNSLKSILSKIDILILNQEEASLLTQIPYQKEKEVFKKLDEMIPGIAVMTKGRGGVIVSDGEYIFEAGILPSKTIEKTGAGDAFSSGFVVGFIKKGDIPCAIQLGTANATSCVQEIGAKAGLLKKGQPWPKVKVVKTKLK